MIGNAATAKIARLERENRRQQIELGAWRSGRLRAELYDSGDWVSLRYRVVFGGLRNSETFDIIEGAVDALVAGGRDDD